jgi:hypothetical protein
MEGWAGNYNRQAIQIVDIPDRHKGGQTIKKERKTRQTERKTAEKDGQTITTDRQ